MWTKPVWFPACSDGGSENRVGLDLYQPFPRGNGRAWPPIGTAPARRRGDRFIRRDGPRKNRVYPGTGRWPWFPRPCIKSDLCPGAGICGTPSLYHFDMYRIESWDDLYSTGFFDYLESGGVLVIEWSENIEGALPAGCIRVAIEPGEKEHERVFYGKGVAL